MATTIKALARGSFATSSATLYTVPSSTTSVVTNIVITNTNASDSGTFTILFDGVEIFQEVSIFAKQTVVVDLKQALSAADTITGYASATDIKYHFTGAEIS